MERFNPEPPEHTRTRTSTDADTAANSGAAWTTNNGTLALQAHSICQNFLLIATGTEVIFYRIMLSRF